MPTLIVLIAVAVMFKLGFWQLDRLAQKEELLAKYAAAQAMSSDVSVAPVSADVDGLLYRHTKLECSKIESWRSVAGRNLRGGAGFSHIARCLVDASSSAENVALHSVDVLIGWSVDPANPDWQGGSVQGIIAPSGKGDFKVVADPPLAGLAANARPDPRDIPNNHFAYAMQWFLFAITALVIYGIALRKRLAAGPAPR